MNCVDWRCVRPLPAVYDDSMSYLEMYCTLAHKVNELIESAAFGNDEIQKQIDELKEYVYGTPWQEAIEKWVVCNLPCIVAQTCRWFHFGIDDNGNVVCTVPFSWSQFEITWNMDYGTEDFGKLTIGW